MDKKELNYQEKQKSGAQMIWDRNKDLGIESASGVGSALSNTKDFREWLQNVIASLEIKTIIDLPCGDWNWMRLVNLDNVSYLGLDIVSECVIENIKKYATPKIRFEQFDAINQNFDFEAPDLIICRDFLFHLSVDCILNVLEKFRKSGAKYLITTTFNSDIVPSNQDLTNEQKEIGWGYRHINLDIKPFDLSSEFEKIDYIKEYENHGREQALYKLK